MLLNYFMNSDLYTPVVFRQTLLFAILGMVFAGCLLSAAQAGVAKALKETETGLSLHPLKMLRLNNLLFAALYLLFGTAMIPAGKPTKSKLKTFLTAAAVPAAGLLFGWGCILLYAATSLVILRSLTISLATFFISGGIFSLLPFPGLPGGNILACLLPEKIRKPYLSLKEYLPLFAVLAAGLLARSGLADNMIAAIITGIGN